MTSNDKQIDLLMRRYAQATPRVPATGHLDADELSAFAEGSLPAATRARYVSHLTDCDDCRKQASAVVISSGAVVRGEQSVIETKEHRSFWQLIAGLFALPVLRYAAFGAVVLIIAGIAFVALRRPANRQVGELLAKNNEPANQQVPSAIKPAADSSNGAGVVNRQANSNLPSTTPLPDGSSASTSGLKRAETGAGEDTAAAPPVMKDAPPPTPAEKKAPQEAVAQKAPSYAPVPPGDVAATQQKQQQDLYREQQAGAGISGPRQQQKLDAADKLADRDREVAKEAGRVDDNARKAGSLAASQPQTASRRGVDEKSKGGPTRNMENNTVSRNESVNRAEPPKTVNKPEADERAKTEEESETRSAGGRKFRRQGSGWVDQKFKSSMALRTVARGSDEFAALDSGLRSIAQQLSGQVIVVWKGKAYLIK